MRDRQPLFVAVSEERVVGFAAVEPCRSHHQFAAEILVLYVEPERRRAGIGWALFDAVQFAMLERGADSILAWIPADAPARHALVRMGGQEVERRVVRALGPPTRQVIHIAYGWRG